MSFPPCAPRRPRKAAETPQPRQGRRTGGADGLHSPAFPCATFPRLSGGINGAGRAPQPGCGRGRPALPASLRRGLARPGPACCGGGSGSSAPWLSSAGGGWSGSCTPGRGERRCPAGPGRRRSAPAPRRARRSCGRRELRRGRGAAPGGEQSPAAVLPSVLLLSRSGG